MKSYLLSIKGIEHVFERLIPTMIIKHGGLIAGKVVCTKSHISFIDPLLSRLY